jgi:hypothetical protein
LHLPANEIGEHVAAIRDVDHVDAGHHPEQRAEQMVAGSNPGGRHVDSARIGLGVGDKLRNRFGWNRWVDLHHIRGADDARDRHDVADEIEIKFVVERRADCIIQPNQEERIPIWGCTHDRLSADIAAGTRSVFDEELLAETLRKPLADQARRYVRRTAGGSDDDDTHRPRRIGLRSCDSRKGQQRRGARG